MCKDLADHHFGVDVSHDHGHDKQDLIKALDAVMEFIHHSSGGCKELELVISVQNALSIWDDAGLVRKAIDLLLESGRLKSLTYYWNMHDNAYREKRFFYTTIMDKD